MTSRTVRSLLPTESMIAPSLLAADFSRLGEQIHAAEAAGAHLFHIDIMDGHFVPNLSMGPPVVQAIRKSTALLFDVHLMLTNPAAFVGPFIHAGADHITIHVEAADDVSHTLRHIRDYGCSCGISLRPGTPAERILPYLSLVDLVLVMTVEPGFGGQKFMADMIPKIRCIRQWLDDLSTPVHLEVDGGIGPTNALSVVEAGVNILVAGTSFFGDPNGCSGAMAKFRSAITTSQR